MGNLADKLDEYLDEQSGVEEVQRFTVTDNDTADWAIRKIVGYQDKIKEARELVEKRIMQYNKWLDDTTKENERQIAFFEGLLLPFAEKQLQGSKKKSIKLPNGTIGFRKSGANFFRDEQPVTGKDEKLTKFVKENAPDYLVVTETTAWGDFKKTLQVSDGKAITADGEVLPGIVAQDAENVFYVKGAEK